MPGAFESLDRADLRTDLNQFQEGYWQGRDRAAREYSLFAAGQRSQTDRPTLPGILLGMLMASIIGGSIAASFYFDSRLTSISGETETLIETLEEQNARIEDERSASGATNAPNQLQTPDVPPANRTDFSRLQQPQFPSSRSFEAEVPVTTRTQVPATGEVEPDSGNLAGEFSTEVSD